MCIQIQILNLLVYIFFIYFKIKSIFILVVDAEISDYTDKINLAVFNGQIENVKEGDEVYVENTTRYNLIVVAIK